MNLQQLDSRVLQLRHQRSHLPELAELRTLQATRKETDDAVRDARIRRDDLATAQQKADRDVESVKTRRTRDQDRIDSGAIANPKDIERMQQELANLERRISVLEDEELEVMEELEAAEGTLNELTERLAAHDERIAEVEARLGERTGEIDAELAEVEGQRGPVVDGLPADLLTLYDKLRESKGGVGAAALRARQCGGCMLSLDAGELARIRGLAADDVVRCEECSRILVRTPESGL